MSWHTSFTSVLLVTILSVVPMGCEQSSTSSNSADLLKDVNIKTETISSAMKSMLAQERYFASSGQTPKHASLFTYWTAFTSTTLDLKRLDGLLVANPDIRLKARNMWMGRVQNKLMELQKTGMLTEMSGPITSRLGAAFGAERVANEGKKMLRFAHSIEKILDIQNPNEQ